MSKTMDRIAKVLNQAENAATPEEAAVYMEKAQKLATLAQIDLAVARAHTVDKEKREEIVVDHAIVANPSSRRFNRKFFLDLCAVLAEVNDCKVLYGGDRIIFATGFPSDIEVAEALFGILSVQMVSECDTALKNNANKRVERRAKMKREEIPDEERAWGDHIGYNKRMQSRGFYADDEEDAEWSEKPLPPKYRNVPVTDDEGRAIIEEKLVTTMDGRLYRQNFYDGFIARTRSRLWEAKRNAREQAGGDIENSSTALALRDKSAEVDKVFDKRLETLRLLNPRGRGYSGAEVSEVNIDAWEHGGNAAERARLDLDENAVEANTTREIG